MSLLGAFNNGVGGLNGTSLAVGAITQNIANLRTPGYRRVEAEFSTLLGGIELQGGVSGGVRARMRQSLETQGQIELTGRQFDLALDGGGFFVFGTFDRSPVGQLRYSRAGDLIPLRAPEDDGIGYLGNETGLYLLGWSIADGAAPGGFGSLGPVPATSDDTFPGQATTRGVLTMTIPAVGTSATTEIFYFDALGDQQTVRLTWTKVAPNDWLLQASDTSGTPLGGPITMQFDGTGDLTSAAEVSIGGLFTLDVSNVVQRGSVTFLGDYNQDGIGRGEFISYRILEDGTVNGTYTSGAVRPLYKIPVATFVFPNALKDESGGLYSATAASGQPILQEADDIDTKVLSSALELANFELADAFTQLIVMQRAYETSAQVVRAVDEMSQVVRDLKR